jgi:hypothetical protein
MSTLGNIEAGGCQPSGGVSAGRANRRGDDDGEIVPQVPGGAGQWKVFGSDQAERPVSTSNFLRRQLTTWSQFC